MVTSGPFSTKVKWAVNHDDLVQVGGSRGMANGYLVSTVRLQTQHGLHEFWMGFHHPNDHYGIDIAANNVNVAVEQIEDAQAPPPAAASPVGIGGGGGFTFSPTGLEEAGEAAKQAYGNARFVEAFQLYVKAIDRLHDFYVFEQFRNREPGPRDAWLVEGMVSSLGAARAMDPNADVAISVREATHRLRTIASATENAGGNPILYRHGLEGLAQCAPDVDVSDIFW